MYKLCQASREAFGTEQNINSNTKHYLNTKTVPEGIFCFRYLFFVSAFKVSILASFSLLHLLFLCAANADPLHYTTIKRISQIK